MQSLRQDQQEMTSRMAEQGLSTNGDETLNHYDLLAETENSNNDLLSELEQEVDSGDLSEVSSSSTGTSPNNNHDSDIGQPNHYTYSRQNVCPTCGRHSPDRSESSRPS